MFELPARRFRLIALDAENLRSSLADAALLERNLRLREGHAAVADELRGPVQQMLDGVLRDPEHYLWHTHWLLVLNRPRAVAGGLCFKGPPDANGEVEIGYGTEAGYRNRGLATAAVRVLCRWALRQPGVTAVLAETEKDNLPSQRVLEKAGFHPFRETDAMRWWASSGIARDHQSQGGTHV